jgi:hypothetical protein
MTISIANSALSNCQSLEQVVELINDDMATDAERHVVAAAYAIDCCEDEDEANIEEVETYLDFLVEAGAKFDFKAAIKRATNEINV